MDVLLHLEFLNAQVQITPTSSECPQPLVPQVGIGNQVLVQSESTEGHSQMFASPPLHVLLPARIGPVPWGSLYLGTLWWEQEWQYFHQVPLVYPSSLQMFIAPCWLFHLQVAKSTVFLKRVKKTNGGFFIGPESDHWECLSLTHSLTDSLTNLLTPV